MRKYSKKYDWSPALAKANNKVYYWRLKLKRSKGFFVSIIIIRSMSLLAALSPDTAFVTNIQEILDRLCSALEERRAKCIYMQSYVRIGYCS
jgi:hypothetical protein